MFLPRCIPNIAADVMVPTSPGLMKITTIDRNAKNIPTAKTRVDFTFGRFAIKETVALVTEELMLINVVAITPWWRVRPTWAALFTV